MNLAQKVERARQRSEVAACNLKAKRDEQCLYYLNQNLTPSRLRPTGYTTPGSAERDFNNMDRERAMSMARQKCEESPVICGMMNSLADNIVGTGYRLSMQSKSQTWNNLVEMRWRFAKDQLDIRGLRSWGRLLRMWFLRRTIDGDTLLNLIGEEKSMVQTIEADRIRDLDNPQSEGIDYDTRGRPERFHVADREQTQGWKNPTTIDASDAIFYFQDLAERAERRRGVSQFLTDFNLFKDIDDIFNAMKIKIKNESVFGLMFKTDPAISGLFGSIEADKASEDGKTRKTVPMVPGLNLNLDPGENAEVIESKSPNQSWMPFVRFALRFGGMPFGLPLEVILLDFSDTNFSGGRAILELAKRRWRVEQQELDSVASRVFFWWLSREMKHNGLEAPAGLNGTEYMHRWGKPAWPYLDPKNEVEAHGAALAFGLTTRDKILSETTDMDVEDVVEQLKYENELYKAAGLNPQVGGYGTKAAGASGEAAAEGQESKPKEGV